MATTLVAMAAVGLIALLQPTTEIATTADCGCTSEADATHGAGLKPSETQLVVFEKSPDTRRLVAALDQANRDIDLDNAEVFTKDGVELLSIPAIERDGGKDGSAMWLQYSQKGGKALAWVLWMKGNGKVEFIASDGKGLELTTDRKGNVLQDRLTSNALPVVEDADGLQLASWGSYWTCVRNCLRTSWGNLPAWLRWVCGGACSSCMWGPNLLSCSACAGCLGGYAGWCLWICRGA